MNSLLHHCSSKLSCSTISSWLESMDDRLNIGIVVDLDTSSAFRRIKEREREKRGNARGADPFFSICWWCHCCRNAHVRCFTLDKIHRLNNHWSCCCCFHILILVPNVWSWTTWTMNMSRLIHFVDFNEIVLCLPYWEREKKRETKLCTLDAHAYLNLFTSSRCWSIRTGERIFPMTFIAIRQSERGRKTTK